MSRRKRGGGVKRRPRAERRAAARGKAGAGPGGDAGAAGLFAGLWDRVRAPQPIERLVFLRIFVPLAILGFLSSRLPYAADWLTARGFHPPALGPGDWRQPLYLPPLPLLAAVLVAILTAGAGLAVAAGLATSVSAGIFGACLVYLALADRLAAFTVSKLGPAVVFGLAASAAGATAGVSAWLARRRAGAEAPPPPTHARAGQVRYFQLLLVTFYCASGCCKMRGDWLHDPLVIWSHLHDSYQTFVAYALARAIPGWGWTAFQWIVLAYEVGAPLWFALRPTRRVALLVGVGMHLFIGLSFGPVIWFSLLMTVLLLGCFAPEGLLRAILGAPRRLLARARTSVPPAAPAAAASTGRR